MADAVKTIKVLAETGDAEKSVNNIIKKIETPVKLEVDLDIKNILSEIKELQKTLQAITNQSKEKGDIKFLNVAGISKMQKQLDGLSNTLTEVSRKISFEDIEPPKVIQAEIDETSQKIEKLKTNSVELNKALKYIKGSKGAEFSRYIFGDIEDFSGLDKYIQRVKQFVNLGGDISQIKIKDKTFDKATQKYITNETPLVKLLQEYEKLENKKLGIDFSQSVLSVEELENKLEELNIQLEKAKAKQDREFTVGLDEGSISAITEAVSKLNVVLEASEGLSLGIKSEDIEKITTSIHSLTESFGENAKLGFDTADIEMISTAFGELKTQLSGINTILSDTLGQSDFGIQDKLADEDFEINVIPSDDIGSNIQKSLDASGPYKLHVEVIVDDDSLKSGGNKNSLLDDYKDLAEFIVNKTNGPADFVKSLQNGIFNTNKDLMDLLERIGMIKDGIIDIKMASGGANNEGGIVGKDYTLLMRNLVEHPHQEMKTDALATKLHEAAELGVQLGDIVAKIKDDSGKAMFEMQTTMSGSPISDTNFDFLQATDEQIVKLIADVSKLKKVGLYVDTMADGSQNILYDEKKGFSFIDLASPRDINNIPSYNSNDVYDIMMAIMNRIGVGFNDKVSFKNKLSQLIDDFNNGLVNDTLTDKLLNEKTPGTNITSLEDKEIKISIDDSGVASAINNVIDELEKLPDKKEVTISVDYTDDAPYLTWENGEVVVGFRGQDHHMENFANPGRRELNEYNGALYYSTNPHTSATYGGGYGGKVGQASFVMKDPLVIDAKGADWTNIKYLGKGYDKVSKEIRDIDNRLKYTDESDPDYHSLKERYREISNDITNPYGTHRTDWWAKYMFDLGYDGIVIKNVNDNAGGSYLGTDVIVKDKSRIKDAQFLTKEEFSDALDEYDNNDYVKAPAVSKSKKESHTISISGSDGTKKEIDIDATGEIELTPKSTIGANIQSAIDAAGPYKIEIEGEIDKNSLITKNTDDLLEEIIFNDPAYSSKDNITLEDYIKQTIKNKYQELIDDESFYSTKSDFQNDELLSNIYNFGNGAIQKYFDKYLEISSGLLPDDVVEKIFNSYIQGLTEEVYLSSHPLDAINKYFPDINFTDYRDSELYNMGMSELKDVIIGITKQADKSLSVSDEETILPKIKDVIFNEIEHAVTTTASNYQKYDIGLDNDLWSDTQFNGLDYLKNTIGSEYISDYLNASLKNGKLDFADPDTIYEKSQKLMQMYKSTLSQIISKAYVDNEDISELFPKLPGLKPFLNADWSATSDDENYNVIDDIFQTVDTYINKDIIDPLTGEVLFKKSHREIKSISDEEHENNLEEKLEGEQHLVKVDVDPSSPIQSSIQELIDGEQYLVKVDVDPSSPISSSIQELIDANGLYQAQVKLTHSDNNSGDNKIINKLTGKEISDQTYDVLKRLKSGENVLKDELLNLPEVVEGNVIANQLRQNFKEKYGDLNDTSEIDTLERKLLREHILNMRLQSGSFSGIDDNGNEVYNGEVFKGGKAVIVTGLPASGKSSSLVNPFSELIKGRVLDNDIIKALLPEFAEGWGADLVHNEAGDINYELLKKTVLSGENLVLPIVGANEDSVQDYVNVLKKAGYDVQLATNEVPNDEALYRNFMRFFGTGRFIEPGFIKDYGNRPYDVFESMLQGGQFSGYYRYNNNVGKGQRPILEYSKGDTGLAESYLRNFQAKRTRATNGDSGGDWAEEIARLNQLLERRKQLNDILQSDSGDSAFDLSSLQNELNIINSEIDEIVSKRNKIQDQVSEKQEVETEAEDNKSQVEIEPIVNAEEFVGKIQSQLSGYKVKIDVEPNIVSDDNSSLDNTISEQVSDTQSLAKIAHDNPNLVYIFDGIQEYVYDVVSQKEELDAKLKEVAENMEIPSFHSRDAERSPLGDPTSKKGDSLSHILEGMPFWQSIGNGTYLTQFFEDMVSWTGTDPNASDLNRIYAIDMGKYIKDLIQFPDINGLDNFSDEFASYLNSYIVKQTKFADQINFEDAPDIKSFDELFNGVSNWLDMFHVTRDQFEAYVKSDIDRINSFDKLDDVGATPVTSFITDVLKMNGINATNSISDSISLGNMIIDLDKNHPYNIDFGTNVDIAKTFYSMVADKIMNLKANTPDADIEGIITDFVPEELQNMPAYISLLKERLKKISDNAKEKTFDELNPQILKNAQEVKTQDKEQQKEQVIGNEVSQALNEEQQVITTSVGTENAALDSLKVKLLEVARAVDDKTDKFRIEAQTVDAAVNGEVTALDSLLGTLRMISDELDQFSGNSAFDDLLKNIKESEEALKSFATILKTSKQDQKDAVKNAQKANDVNYDDNEMKKRERLIREEAERISAGTEGDEVVTNLKQMYDSHDNLVEAILTIEKQIHDENEELLSNQTETYNIHWDKKGNQLYSSRMTSDDYKSVQKQQEKEYQDRKKQEEQDAKLRIANNNKVYEAYQKQQQQDQKKQDSENEKRYKNNLKAISDLGVANSEKLNLSAQKLKTGSIVDNQIEENNNAIAESAEKAKSAIQDMFKMYRSGDISKEQFNTALEKYKSQDVQVGSAKALDNYYKSILDTYKMLSEKEAKDGVILTQSEADRLDEAKQKIDELNQAKNNGIQLSEAELNVVKQAEEIQNKIRQGTKKDTETKPQKTDDDDVKQAINNYEKLSMVAKDYSELKKKIDKEGIGSLNKGQLKQYSDYTQMFNQANETAEKYGDTIKELVDAQEKYNNAVINVSQSDEQKQLQKQQKVIDSEIGKIQKKYEGVSVSDQTRWSSQYADLGDSLNKAFATFKGSDAAVEDIRELNNAADEAFATFSRFQKLPEGKIVDQTFGNIDEAKSYFESMVNSYKTVQKGVYGSIDLDSTGIAKWNAQVMDAKGNVTGLAATWDAELNKMVISSKQLPSQLVGISGVIDGVKRKIKELATYWTARLFDPMDIMRYSKQIFNIIREYDDALTEMRKVSDESVSTLKEFQQESFNIASVLGTTGKQIQQSTADWLRLGESFDEAQNSAQISNLLLNVSEFSNIDDATESLVSASQAYKDLDKIDIVDKLNNIGNNFSISTDQLAKGLQNAAAVLQTQGNSLDQSLALLTAGNAITQDISKTSAGVRTIALRISGTEEAKDAIQDMGEDIDDFVVRTKSKTDSIIRDYTAVAENAYKGVSVLDENGNLRDTYDILLDISKIYKKIIEEDKRIGTNRAQALVETLAGKNRSNIAASILQNPQMLEDVYNASLDSAGSAMIENEKFLDSISGKVNILQNQLQELANIAISSDSLKMMLDIVNSLLSGVTSLASKFGVLNTVIGAFAGVLLQKKSLGVLATSNGKGWSTLLSGLFSGKPSTQLITKTFQPLEEAQAKYLMDATANLSKDGSFFAQLMANGSTMDMLKSNPFYGELIKTVGEEKAMMMDYNQVMAAVATGQVQVAQTATNAASSFAKLGSIVKTAASSFLTMGVAIAAMAAVGFVVKEIYNMVTAHQRAIEAGKEAINTINDTKEAYDNTKKSITELSNEYAKLSTGVEVNGNKVINKNLSEEEFERYIEISKQISELAPELVTGYTDQGEAIVNLGNTVEQVNSKFQDFLQTERDIANTKIGQNLDTAFKSITEQVDEYQSKLSVKKQETDKFNNIAKEIGIYDENGEQQPNVTNGTKSLRFKQADLSGLTKLLSGMPLDDYNAPEEIGESGIYEIQIDISSLTGKQLKDINSYINGGKKVSEKEVKSSAAMQKKYQTLIDAEYKKAIPIIQDYIDTTFMFDDLKESMQEKFRQGFSGLFANIDYGSVKDDIIKAGGLERWVDDIVSSLIATEQTKDAFSGLIDLAEKRGSMTYKAYIEARNKYFDTIIDEYTDEETGESLYSYGNLSLMFGDSVKVGEAVEDKMSQRIISAATKLGFNNDEYRDQFAEMVDSANYANLESALNAIERMPQEKANEIAGKWDDFWEYIAPYINGEKTARKLRKEGTLEEIIKDESFKSLTDDFEKKVSSLTGAIQTLRENGKLTDDEMADLFNEFPSLASKVAEAGGKITESILSEKSMTEISDWVKAFRSNMDDLSDIEAKGAEQYLQTSIMSYLDEVTITEGMARSVARKNIVTADSTMVDDFKDQVEEYNTIIDGLIERYGDNINWEIVWDLAVNDMLSSDLDATYAAYDGLELQWDVHVINPEIEQEVAQLEKEISGRSSRKSANEAARDYIQKTGDYDAIMNLGKNQNYFNKRSEEYYELERQYGKDSKEVIDARNAMYRAYEEAANTTGDASFEETLRLDKEDIKARKQIYLDRKEEYDNLKEANGGIDDTTSKEYQDMQTALADYYTSLTTYDQDTLSSLEYDMLEQTNELTRLQTENTDIQNGIDEAANEGIRASKEQLEGLAQNYKDQAEINKIFEEFWEGIAKDESYSNSVRSAAAENAKKYASDRISATKNAQDATDEALKDTLYELQNQREFLSHATETLANQITEDENAGNIVSEDAYASAIYAANEELRNAFQQRIEIMSEINRIKQKYIDDDGNINEQALEQNEDYRDQMSNLYTNDNSIKDLQNQVDAWNKSSREIKRKQLETNREALNNILDDINKDISDSRGNAGIYDYFKGISVGEYIKKNIEDEMHDIRLEMDSIEMDSGGIQAQLGRYTELNTRLQELQSTYEGIIDSQNEFAASMRSMPIEALANGISKFQENIDKLNREQELRVAQGGEENTLQDLNTRMLNNTGIKAFSTVQNMLYNVQDQVLEALDYSSESTERQDLKEKIQSSTEAVFNAMISNVNDTKTRNELQVTQAEKEVGILQTKASLLQNTFDELEYRGQEITAESYDGLINNAKQNIKIYEDTIIPEYRRLMEEAVEKGRVVDAVNYYDQWASSKGALADLNKQVYDWEQAQANIPVLNLQNALSDLQSKASEVQDIMNFNEAKGLKASVKDYEKLTKNSKEQIKNLQQQNVELRKQTIGLDKNGSKYREINEQIKSNRNAIRQAQQDILGYQKSQATLVSTQAQELTSALSSAMSEMNSESGISVNTIEQLEKAFSDLYGRDISNIFYESSNGMKMNINAAKDLIEAEYELKASDLKSEIEAQNKIIESQKGLYTQDAQEAVKSANMRIEAANRELAVLQALYNQQQKSLSGYTQWQLAQSTENAGARYEGLYGNVENIKKAREQHLTNTDEFKTYVKMLDQYGSDTVSAYERVLPKIDRYLTEDYQGTKNFYDDLVAKGYGTYDKNGYKISTPDVHKAAQDLGISDEWFNIMASRGEDYGFVNDWVSSVLDGELKIKDTTQELIDEQNRYQELLAQGAPEEILKESEKVQRSLKNSLTNFHENIEDVRKTEGKITASELQIAQSKVEAINDLLKEGIIDRDIAEENIQEIADETGLELTTDIKGNLIVDEEATEEKFPEWQVKVQPVIDEDIDVSQDYGYNQTERFVSEDFDTGLEKVRQGWEENKEAAIGYINELSSVSTEDLEAIMMNNGDWDAGFENAEKALENISKLFGLTRQEAEQIVPILEQMGLVNNQQQEERIYDKSGGVSETTSPSLLGTIVNKGKTGLENAFQFVTETGKQKIEEKKEQELAEYKPITEALSQQTESTSSSLTTIIGKLGDIASTLSSMKEETPETNSNETPVVEKPMQKNQKYNTGKNVEVTDTGTGTPMSPVVSEGSVAESKEESLSVIGDKIGEVFSDVGERFDTGSEQIVSAINDLPQSIGSAVADAMNGNNENPQLESGESDANRPSDQGEGYTPQPITPQQEQPAQSVGYSVKAPDQLISEYTGEQIEVDGVIKFNEVDTSAVDETTVEDKEVNVLLKPQTEELDAAEQEAETPIDKDVTFTYNSVGEQPTPDVQDVESNVVKNEEVHHKEVNEEENIDKKTTVIDVQGEDALNIISDVSNALTDLQNQQTVPVIDANNASALQKINETSSALSNLNGQSATVYVNLSGGSLALSTLRSIGEKLAELDGKTVTSTIIERKIEEPHKFTGTMLSPAHSSGTVGDNLDLIKNIPITEALAFGNGNVGLPDNEEALVNELGTESIIRDGHWFLIPGGMHVESLKKGDVILNHLQTKQLIESGRALGHGKAYAQGTAFNGMPAHLQSTDMTNDDPWADKSINVVNNDTQATYEHTGAVNNDTGATEDNTGSTNDNTEATKKSTQAYDWVERRLKYFSEAVEKITSQITDYVSYAFKKNQILQQLKKLNKEIETSVDAMSRYREKAESIVIDTEDADNDQRLKQLVREGNVESIQKAFEEWDTSDENSKFGKQDEFGKTMSDRLSEYMDYWDKSVESNQNAINYNNDLIDAYSQFVNLPLDQAAEKLEGVNAELSNLDTVAGAIATGQSGLAAMNRIGKATINNTKEGQIVQKYSGKKYKNDAARSVKAQNELLDLEYNKIRDEVTINRRAASVVKKRTAANDSKLKGVKKSTLDYYSDKSLKKELKKMSKGGSVDLTNRKKISTNKLKKAGWKDVGDGYATTYTSTVSNKDGTIAMNFTPILPNGEVLTPEKFDKYCSKVLEGGKDDLNLKIGATFTGEDAISKAENEAQKAHEKQEEFYDSKREKRRKVIKSGKEIDVSNLSGDALKNALKWNRIVQENKAAHDAQTKAIENTTKAEAELAAKGKENADKRFQNWKDYYESYRNYYKSGASKRQSNYSANTFAVDYMTQNEYKQQRTDNATDLKYARNEVTALRKSLAESVRKKEIKAGSTEWKEKMAEINNLEAEINQTREAQLQLFKDWANAPLEKAAQAVDKLKYKFEGLGNVMDALKSGSSAVAQFIARSTSSMGNSLKGLFSGNSKTYIDQNKILDNQKKTQESIVKENRKALADAKTNKKTAETASKKANKTKTTKTNALKKLTSSKKLNKSQKQLLQNAIKNGTTVDLDNVKFDNIKDAATRESVFNTIKEYNAAVQAKKDAATQVTLANQAIEEADKTLYESEVELARMTVDNEKEKFNNIKEYWEKRREELKTQHTLEEKEFEWSSAHGNYATLSSYDTRINNRKAEMKQMVQERNELQKKLDASVKSGIIKEQSDEWKEMKNQITSLNIEIKDTTIEIENLVQEQINLKYDEYFERAAKMADEFIQRLQTISGLISEDMMFDEDGFLTKYGALAMQENKNALDQSINNLKTYMSEREAIIKDYNNGKFGQDEFNQKMAENQGQINKYLSDANSTRQTILTIIKNQSKAELDAINKNINAYKEMLSRKKAYYDYDKQLKDKTKNLQSLEKELAALKGVAGMEAEAQRARIKAQLDEANQDMEDTVRDHIYELQVQGLDDLMDQLQENYDDWVRELSQDLDKASQTIADAIKNSGDERTITSALNSALKQFGISNYDLKKINYDTGYASGTKRVKKNELALTNEPATGREIIITKSGILTQLTPGDAVMPNNLTENFFAAAQNYPMIQKTLDNLTSGNKIGNINSMPSVIQPNISCPITINGSNLTATEVQGILNSFIPKISQTVQNDIRKDLRKNGR